MPAILGTGAFLKNTLCLSQGGEAWLTRDVGNLETVDSVRAFDALAADLIARAGGALAAVAHDWHPDFHSSRYAEALAAEAGIQRLPIQHHHAHVAAVMAEHGVEEPVLGLALDGFGLGADGEAWGGELLAVDGEGFGRLGHLAPLRQPGGDKAARQPWRMAAAVLHGLGRGREIVGRFAGIEGAGVIVQMLDRGVNCPATTSCGRLFDAACGLLGVKLIAQFEGEAPMALEALTTAPVIDAGGWRLDDGVLDFSPVLDRLSAMEGAEGANLFHGTLAAGMTAWAGWAAEVTGVRTVVLSGGCFLNKVLTAGLVEGLRGSGLSPLLPQRLTPGDPAISLGQVWAAAMAKG
jgi:hydrogenase maturation protein HypF